MQIAIVAPSPVPFVVGGAENLWWGLQSYINQATSHSAELIKVSLPDSNFWDVIEGYRRFSELDLSHFDLVISTKHPAWMVRHPNHLCYMQHRLRGLYDTYWMTSLPLKYETAFPPLVKIRQLMRGARNDPKVLPEWFERMRELRDSGEMPDDAASFPGPFARQCIHFLDGIALSTTAVRRHCAISKTVAQRKDYFPHGAAVDVVYHPSNLTTFRCGPGEYLFTASRLDASKRIDLLVDAMPFVKSPIELRIAGCGGCERELKEAAGSDERIRFLGYVSSDDLIDQYAHAIAVPFVPYDEDLGLITLEAMRSGKAVLTTTDSGGPSEFVRDGQTGFSVKPDPQALAERIDYLWTHRAEARLMGLNGQKVAEEITWERTVSQLLSDAPRRAASPVSMHTGRRRKMVVASPFGVHPPIGGGQQRTFHLLRHFARRFDIELVSFVGAEDKPFNGEIAPGLREVRIPRSAEHAEAERAIASEVEWESISDVVLPELHQLTPAFASALARAAKSADCMVASHPYVFPAIESVWDGPVWFDSHNVEALLKDAIIPKTERGLQLLESVRQVEHDCARQSCAILACSEEDRQAYHELYGCELEKMLVVPNGVCLESTVYTPPAERAATKRKMSNHDAFIALFLGSWHGPNLRAVNHIIEFAKQLPEMIFMVLGSAGEAFKESAIPRNVILLGVVSDEMKANLFCTADLALNPMETGSGTNLKVLDYCAAGIPVLSTSFGVRGLGLQEGLHLQLAAIEQFPQILRETARLSAVAKQGEQTDGTPLRVAAARHHVSVNFDWSHIAERALRRLNQLGESIYRIPRLVTTSAV